MAAPRPTDVSLPALHRTFISGSHILHHHGILDAYGHLSVRHPSDPTRFIMSRYIAPGTISSPSDLVEYYVSNAEPVDPSSPKGYSERCIHSEILRRFPGVNSVIHSHAEDVVAYGIVGGAEVPMKACYHMAGFLGSRGVPTFEIADVFREEDTRDMLVRNTYLGGKLAECFSEPSGKSSNEPDHPVVLMRGHGFTVAAPSIEDCVLRAVYTQKNAMIQTRAITLASAAGGEAAVKKIRYLDEAEAQASAEMTKWSAMRPWKLWVREVEAMDLYVNLT